MQVYFYQLFRYYPVSFCLRKRKTMFDFDEELNLAGIDNESTGFDYGYVIACVSFMLLAYALVRAIESQNRIDYSDRMTRVLSGSFGLFLSLYASVA